MISSKLLQKSFDLKKNTIYGGTNDTNTTASAKSHTQDGCTDVITEVYDEKGRKISLCTSYDCPDVV